MVSVGTIQLPSCSMKMALDHRYTNGHGCVPKKPLFLDAEFGFPIILMCHRILFFFYFFSQSSKNHPGLSDQFADC